MTYDTVEAAYWKINIDGWKIGKGSLRAATNAIVDSGTSLITGPSSDIRSIATSIGAQATILGQYTINCDNIDNIPTLTFVIDGKAYPLNGKDLVLQTSGMCLLALIGMDFAEPGPKWILVSTAKRILSHYIGLSQISCFSMSSGRRFYAPLLYDI